MRIVFTFLMVLSIVLNSFTQGNDYDELLILKADQNWEKLILKAEKMTNRNRTEDDPVYYYYLAYGLYKISFIGDRPDEYKNAFKDALTIVGKLGRKDEEGYVEEEYAEFFDELKGSLLEIIRNEIETGEYRRAFGWVMKIYKFDRDNIAGKYLEGACRFRNGDKSTARLKWKEGKELIDALDSVDHWTESDRAMIKFGLYESAKCQKESRQQEAATEIMNIGAQWFEEDEDWQRWYDEIVN